MLRQGLKEYSAWPTFPQVTISNYIISQAQCHHPQLSDFWLCCKSVRMPNQTLHAHFIRRCRQAVTKAATCFPQVYVDGEFFGGCDIMIGEWLQTLLSNVSCHASTSVNTRHMPCESRMLQSPSISACTWRSRCTPIMCLHLPSRRKYDLELGIPSTRICLDADGCTGLLLPSAFQRSSRMAI